MKSISLPLIIIMVSILSCFAEEQHSQNNDYDHYYSKLHQEALDNLENMPRKKADIYREMLEDNPNIVMAFILAKEESSKLLLADPDVLKSHYEAISELWEDLHQQYSIPFFLSYIAKVTVTEERITPYRELFREKGLYELPGQYPELEELAREVNLWTRRFMTFQPTSGRDMAPTDIINRTNIGRCEEMMIFFISAARSLGIPARPASTPYWGHIDNNHAWVEVYVEGEWRHLGAVEPAYNLDDAWFSSSAARAIVITATAAFPDTSDIVIGSRGYSSVINSTPNYDSPDSQARKIYVVTKDENGRIIPECQVALQVFNWGRLRPIMRRRTDEEGLLELTTGNGSFFISAFKDSLIALKKVPANINNYGIELILRSPEELPAFSSAELIYREQEVERYSGPPEWQERRQEVNDAYSSLVESYQERTFPEETEDSLLLEVWEKSRNNKDNFYEFYVKNQPDSLFLHYLTEIDPKFLWQADLQQFDNIYDRYLRIQKQDLDYSENAILSLLSPTVFFEEIPSHPLKRRLTRWTRGRNRKNRILSYLEKNYEIDNDKAVQAFQMPADILMDLPVLTNYQYKILTCAVFNENFIPARYTRLSDIINVYNNGSWNYYDISKKEFLTQEEEDEQKYPVSISVNDEHGLPIKLEDNQFTLTFLRNGFFYPSQTPIRLNEEDILEAELTPGNYQLHIGYRPSNSLTYFTLENINLTEKPISRSITLEGYPKEWEGAPDEMKELIFSLKQEDPNLKNVFNFLLGNHDREMVRRLSERLENQAEPGEFVWIGMSDSPDTPEYYKAMNVYAEWLEQNPQYADRVITINRVSEEDEEDSFTYFDGIWDTLPE